MLRDSRASARRLSAAAVMAVGMVAPLVAATGGAQAASGRATGAGTSTPVTNGPIIYGDQPDNQPTKLTTKAMNPDGSGQHQLADSHACGDSAYTAPGSIVYAPDGTMAAIGCGDGQVHIATADLSRTAVILPWQQNQEISPVAWSADGKTIYYDVLDLRDSKAPPVLWSIRTDGSGKAPVTTVPAGYRLQSIAADGTMSLTSGAGSNSSVSVLSPGASTPRLISSQEVGLSSLSADGTKVATVEYQYGAIFLKVYNSDGSNSGGVTLAKMPPDNTIGTIALSPDGHQLAYTRYLPGATPTSGFSGTQIWTIGTEGAALPVKLTESADVLSLEAWHSGPLSQTPRGVVQRLAGADRIGTAVATADAAYSPLHPGTTRAKTAVISRADSFADALAGNALAAQKHGPLLLTGSASLDPRVAHELSALLDADSTVYVLGGPQALSPQIDAQIRALGMTPKRLAGTDRFSTATAIAAEVATHPHTVLVATGTNFPDALAAGAAAATDPDGGVVLLTDDKTVPSATRAYLNSVNPATTKVYGVGRQGVAALNTTALTGHFTPLAGDDRCGTDLAVANDTTLFPAPLAAGVATGENWPDALSGGAYVGALKSPLLLTEHSLDSMGTSISVVHADFWLMAHTLTLQQVSVFGGSAVYGDSYVKGFGQAAFGAGNFDVR
ncbi:MAG: cell wall-binding repeat-containing protein [Catenulispora sp.]|nr:cell wall-binding repeat-containing protein [Catenulispora sp.]